MEVGHRLRSFAKYSKSSSWSFIDPIRQIRSWSWYFRPSCSILNRPRLPGIPIDMLRNSPRILCQTLVLTLLQGCTYLKISLSRCFRWGGNSRVPFKVSISQHKIFLCVSRYASPLRSFLVEGTWLRIGLSSSSTGRETLSMECNRHRRSCKRAADVPCTPMM
jgi:hypothetical protein